MHFAAKNVCPAVASPTSTSGGGVSTGGGDPCLPAAASRLCRNVGQGLGIGRVDRRHGRHALLRPSALDDRNDRFAILVGQHQLRPEKVRPAQLTATGVHAVAGAAGHRVQRPAALDDRWIARRPLLLEKDRRTAALASAAGWGGCRWCRRSRRLPAAGASRDPAWAPAIVTPSITEVATTFDSFILTVLKCAQRRAGRDSFQ